MWVPLAFALAALLLAAAGAAATALHSSLLILGEEGLAEDASGGEESAAELLAAIRDPRVRHPFALWVAASACKASACVCAGGAALSLFSAFHGLAGAGYAGGWVLLFLLVLFLLENLSVRGAMTNPRRILRGGGRFCLRALRGAGPPARALDRLGRLLFGAGYVPGALLDIRFGSEEGILDVIEEGAEHGTIDPAEERMIEGVLRLRESVVNEVMTPWSGVVCLRKGTPHREAVAVAAAAGFTRYPVLGGDGQDLEGIFASRNFFRPEAQENWERFVEKPVYIPESMKVADLLRRFQRSRVSLAVVIDEHGKLCGVVTIHDLFEEIVGRLAEGEEPREGPEWEKDGALSVPAATPVRILRDEFGIGIPLGDTYETAGGFALDRLQDVPEGVVTFLAHGYRITVAETERFRIKRLRIEKAVSGTR
ncbi:MAG TPA: CBS domain-containing protein [Candidatus Aquicultoraceae bacterium]|nr:CBS domain-containing protein [Candidatus Aquicultoraceae bacterium]